MNEKLISHNWLLIRMGSYRDNQGKRDDQVEFSNWMATLSILGIILLLVIGFLHQTISRLVHYIMG